MKTKLALMLALLMLLFAFAGCKQKTELAAEATPARHNKSKITQKNLRILNITKIHLRIKN